MSRCWVLIITRGLRVWVPPEVYVHDQATAVREAGRWRDVLRISAKLGEYSPRAKALHLIQSVFPDPWRACPVWVGVAWSVRSYPKMRIELMAADEQEAADWLRRRAPARLGISRPGQFDFQRHDYLTSAGVFRLKRVTGF